MQVPLSPQQRDAIAAHPEEPFALVDEQLRQLIQEGIDSPEIPAVEAFDRLRRFAISLHSGS